MSRSKTAERTKPILFMLVITAVFISAVSGTYLAFSDEIKRNRDLARRQSIMEAAGLQIPEDPAALEQRYLNRIQEFAVTNQSSGKIERYCHVFDENGGRQGLIVDQAGTGLWGTIRAVIGFRAGDASLTGVRFTDHHETPGLGARIEEERFKAQFVDKQGPFAMVPEGEPTDPNEFDAITGATVTSTAVRRILNRAHEKAMKMNNSQQMEVSHGSK